MCVWLGHCWIAFSAVDVLWREEKRFYVLFTKRRSGGGVHRRTQQSVCLPGTFHIDNAPKGINKPSTDNTSQNVVFLSSFLRWSSPFFHPIIVLSASWKVCAILFLMRWTKGRFNVFICCCSVDRSQSVDENGYQRQRQLMETQSYRSLGLWFMELWMFGNIN